VDCGTPTPWVRLRSTEGGKTVVQRQLVRAAAVSAVFIGLALAALSTGDEARPAEAKLDPGVGVVKKIKRYQRATWRWERLMGVPRTPTRKRYLRVRNLEYRVFVMHQWRRRAVRAKRRAHNPPHKRAWRCLQRYEGAWNDANDPYWGGLQMDRTFMRQYAPRHLLRRGWANRWTAVEQMWVGERALRAGRGFYPWPHTGRMCGLI
jgi:hypothetical protein